MADHKTSSIVIVIRGSLSLRDLITDIAAASDSFEPEGLPPGSMVLTLVIRIIFTQSTLSCDFFNFRMNLVGDIVFQAHRGMIIGAKVLLKQLDQYKVLENAFKIYPHYDLTLTGTLDKRKIYVQRRMTFFVTNTREFRFTLSGHSLGAGLAVLLGTLIRPRYPHLRVYAFSTPGTS